MSIFGPKKWGVVFTCLAVPALAGDRVGFSAATTNDSLGEYLDRWQSSSVQVDVFTAHAWTGEVPARFGEVLNWRFRTDILTPEDLDNPDPDDRRHAAILAFGVHSMAARGAWDARIGGDLVVIGPQTKQLEFQRELHKILGFERPQLEDFQIGNSTTGQISGEAGWTYQGDGWHARPFIEAQIGPEDLVRTGVDLTFGSMGRDDLMVRLPATGHLVPGILGETGRGASFFLGADIAWVEDSIYLPESLGYELTDYRARARAGVAYEFDRLNLFYGISWLSEEFEAQRESQIVGALQLGLRF